MERVDDDALRRRVKAEIRARMRAVRKAIPDSARLARSQAIAERVLARDEWRRARCVMVFLSMRREVETAPLIAAARAEGKRVVAPRMTEHGLEIRAHDEGVPPIESGSMRVPEPPESAPLVDPGDVDLVIVPALALDEEGARIGYGAGLYDGLLPRLSRARSIGVAFDFQLISEVPETPGDRRVDVVITDQRTIDVVPTGTPRSSPS